MHMVGHQRISMNPAISLAGVLGQPIQITAIIFIGEKARLAVITALDEMDGNIGHGNAGAAWHGELFFSEEEHSLAGIRKPWSVPYFLSRNAAWPSFQARAVRREEGVASGRAHDPWLSRYRARFHPYRSEERRVGKGS